MHQLAGDFAEEMVARGYALDFSEESAAELERVVRQVCKDTDPRSETAQAIGAYLGELIVRNRGGRWVELGDSFGVDLPDGARAMPLDVVADRLRSGPAQDLGAYFRSLR